MTTPPHLNWLVDSGQRLQTSDGHEIEVWELRHENDPITFSAWAKHFREHYCDDGLLPLLVQGTGKTHAEFLLEIKFPDQAQGFGPSVRAGDFAEILIADYIQYKLGYWCPRELRYEHKWNRDESTKGCDVIGFRLVSEGQINPQDELFVFESKAQLSESQPANKLQEAVNDSKKDPLREAMTLSALKQRFIEKRDAPAAHRIERFQDIADRPFRRINGAAAVYTDNMFDPQIIGTTTADGHPNRDNLKLIVVKGATLMLLVHALYERAANEA